MKITFESYWKRAAALNKKEPDLPTRFIKSHQKDRKKRILLPSTNKIEIYKINLTNALSKVRSSAASAKSWQSYNDTRVGVRWSRRSMVTALLLLKSLKQCIPMMISNISLNNNIRSNNY